MATDLAKRQEGAQFSILDPPSLPQKPYWPNPLQLSLAGLVAGLVASLAGVLLKEALDPHIYTEQEMRHWINTPVIATVPPLLTLTEQGNQARHRLFGLLAGAVIAIIVPLATLIAYLRR